MVLGFRIFLPLLLTRVISPFSMLSLMSSGSKTIINLSFIVTLSHFDTHETIKPRFPANRLETKNEKNAYRRDQETDLLGSPDDDTQRMNFARAWVQRDSHPNGPFDCLRSPSDPESRGRPDYYMAVGTTRNCPAVDAAAILTWI